MEGKKENKAADENKQSISEEGSVTSAPKEQAVQEEKAQEAPKEEAQKEGAEEEAAAEEIVEAEDNEEGTQGKKTRKKKAEKQEDTKWYVIQTLTGYEDRVKSNIERNVKGTELENSVFNILVPEEDTVEIRKGKRIEKKKKMFPGYVFIEMILDDNSWYGIRKTTGVARFIGSKTHPMPVVDREMQRVLKQLGVREEKIEISFEKGETVRIISGPFRGYTGTVEEINAPREKFKALVNIFGRDTPVEIGFEQAEKAV